MISKDKTYRTYDGREVRIYATDGAGENPVHGAIKNKFGLWIAWQWTHGGTSHPQSYDLIEVRPRHKRTVWFNAYDDSLHGFYNSREEADEWAVCIIKDLIVKKSRIACIKVDLDFEEGEGL